MSSLIQAPAEHVPADKDDLIRSLLAVVRIHGVDLPPGLLAQLHDAQDPTHPYITERERRQSVHYLQQRCRRQKSGMLDEIDQIFRIIRRIGEGKLRYELRVRGASYTLTKVEHSPAEKNDLYVDEEDHPGRGSGGGGGEKGASIQNIANSSPIYKLVSNIVSCCRGVTMNTVVSRKVLLGDVNLRLQSGKTYLVLGAPGSGKSLLLKTIANILRQDAARVKSGSVTINGRSPRSKGVCWSNLVSYTDQIDRLHAMLTVQETCQFAFECRSAGTHRKSFMRTDAESNDIINTMDREGFRVNNVVKNFGLERVRDTFVGDDSKVRGVSGGERKRVTVSEMIMLTAPVLCLDEISTGLDAATTYDIIKLLSRVTSFMDTIPIVSLLQPPPEVVALFDEIILLDSGRVIYSGPVDRVVPYFEGLGYEIPDRMDVADWLQELPTKEGAKYLKQYQNRPQRHKSCHMTNKEFVAAFNASDQGKGILASLDEPLGEEVSKIMKAEEFSHQYRNPWYRSIWLVFKRELLLWRRDTYNLRAKIGQDIMMGIIVGTVFYQTPDPGAILGVIFQSLLMMSLGSMLSTPQQVDKRAIFYKHQDANFFPTWTFVVGRSLAALPQSFIDSVIYGTFVYWFVGLAHDGGASVGNYFIFLLIVLAASYVAALMFSIFSSALPNKAATQAGMAVMLVVMVIFSGFTVQPDVIPPYWIWVYWMNLFAWMLRSLVVNEFQSGAWDSPNPITGETMGDSIMQRFGFGEFLEYEWVWYGLAFAAGVGILAAAASVFFLNHFRYETGKTDSTNTSTMITDGTSEEEEIDSFDLPFKRANLSWKGIRYTVTASTSNEPIELLKGIDGYVEAGTMTALMGSSGAGKTTLMDVLALRKTSGEIEGEVRLNGYLQEKDSFRRCAGYVEQFDVQTPQLTVLETVKFSAKLRLDEKDRSVTKESIEKFVIKTLRTLELTSIQDAIVGDDLSGGLSFEQRKRLAIAVELVSNPSIIFLDEPTSGLDARAAAVVMRGLKRIAETGRAVCATIHQPSQAIFNSFDSLLLLRRGGEVVYFGELGHESAKLIEYLERFQATPRIQPGENPATWMLKAIGAGSSGTANQFDYASRYTSMDLRKRCLARIDAMERSTTEDNQIRYPHKYATSKRTQRLAVFKRLMTIYWRSPSYNLLRVLVGVVVAFILGSIYVTQRTPTDESDMNSRITSIFVSAVFLGVSSFNGILALFETERNMFYRHKSALMYNSSAINLAFTFAEIPFLIWAGIAFCTIFYFMVGFAAEAAKFFTYFLFFTLNITTFTYLGQMLMAVMRDAETAQLLGSGIMGMSALFCGILIKPQFISNFWIFMYWVTPLHYILEGLIASQFHADTTPILASPGSPFFNALVQRGDCVPEIPECYGTAEIWVDVTFGGWFTYDNIWRQDLPYLLGLCCLSRIVCYAALTKLNYLKK